MLLSMLPLSQLTRFSGEVEMIVLRNATGLDANFMKYFQKIIHEAGQDRRTCRVCTFFFRNVGIALSACSLAIIP